MNCYSKDKIYTFFYFPGFMVGREVEAGDIAKHGAKMVTVVACATVFQFILLLH